MQRNLFVALPESANARPTLPAFLKFDPRKPKNDGIFHLLSRCTAEQSAFQRKLLHVYLFHEKLYLASASNYQLLRPCIKFREMLKLLRKSFTFVRSK